MTPWFYHCPTYESTRWLTSKVAKVSSVLIDCNWEKKKHDNGLHFVAFQPCCAAEEHQISDDLVVFPVLQIWITAKEQGVKAATFFWPWYWSWYWKIFFISLRPWTQHCTGDLQNLKHSAEFKRQKVCFIVCLFWSNLYFMSDENISRWSQSHEAKKREKVTHLRVFLKCKFWVCADEFHKTSVCDTTITRAGSWAHVSHTHTHTHTHTQRTLRAVSSSLLKHWAQPDCFWYLLI